MTLASILDQPDSQARAIALQSWLENHHGQPTAQTELQAFIHQETSSEVLAIAIPALAQYWHDEPSTLNWFKTYAQYANSPVVRALAIEALARGWPAAFNVFEILSKCAFADRFIRRTADELNPRQQALAMMIECYPDRHQTWEFVRDRAANDPDAQLRQFAQAQLVANQKT